FAGILIAAPVAGLRPIRALRAAFTSFPTPGIVNWPCFLVWATARLPYSSIISPAVFFESPNLSAKWAAIWLFVICLAALVCSLFIYNELPSLRALPALLLRQAN